MTPESGRDLSRPSRTCTVCECEPAKRCYPLSNSKRVVYLCICCHRSLYNFLSRRRCAFHGPHCDRDENARQKALAVEWLSRVIPEMMKGCGEWSRAVRQSKVTEASLKESRKHNEVLRIISEAGQKEKLRLEQIRAWQQHRPIPRLTLRNKHFRVDFRRTGTSRSHGIMRDDQR